MVVSSNTIIFGPRNLQLPCYFASVSSVKTNFQPLDYVCFLERFGYPSYLISAYDLMATRDPVTLPGTSRSSVILLDSGNYEAYWLRDKAWDRVSYQKAVQTTSADLFCTFDNPWERNDNHEFSGIDASKLVPIVHGDPKSLPNKVLDTARKIDSPLIGIPERELGDGVVQRALTLQRVHSKLLEGKYEHQIHLLGTGNPLSILLYVACGAASFDGLEWCQTCVDPMTARLVHFSQREITDCHCMACNSGSSYSAATLGHNLIFYIDWMEQIRKHKETNSLADLLGKYFSPPFLKQIGLELK